jgi:hypothetical protein
MNRRPILIAAGAVAALVGWYLFRPELLFIDQAISESFPAATVTSTSAAPDTMLLRTGMFHGVAHETRGNAAIHQLPGGQRVLRLTNFETSNGPDVRVLLIASTDAADNDTVKNSAPIELGKLKGNVGDQNYDVPAGVDLNKYQAVTIWCNRFSVNFGAAPLGLPGAPASAGMMAPAAPTAVLSGAFHGVAHETKGTAALYELDGGKRVLRLTNFETSNGPDVRVLLVAAADAADNDTVKNSAPIELGKLKGNVGDQNYDVPAGVDLSKYRAVTIWCNRFSVNFGTAPLM